VCLIVLLSICFQQLLANEIYLCNNGRCGFCVEESIFRSINVVLRLRMYDSIVGISIEGISCLYSSDIPRQDEKGMSSVLRNQIRWDNYAIFLVQYSQCLTTYIMKRVIFSCTVDELFQRYLNE
jgi:hypothetical protein